MKKFLIGVVGPFSGPRSCYGDLLANTVLKSDYAPYFEYIFKDDQADPRVSKIIAKELIEANVQGVIGHFNSKSAVAAAEIYPSSIPVALPASTALELCKFSNIYRCCATDLQQAQHLIKFKTEIKHKKCYIWHDNSAYALSIYQYLPQDIDILDITHKLSDQDLVILLGSHYNVANLISMLNYSGKITAICSDDCSIDEFKKLTFKFSDIKKYIVQPSPSFTEGIELGLDTLYRLLANNKREIMRENKAATFEILQLD